MKKTLVKFIIRTVNILSRFKISLPAVLIERTLRLVWEHPWILKPMITTIRSQELERIAKKLLLYRFNHLTPLVPALRDLYQKKSVPSIKTMRDFKKYVPITDKETYIEQYPLEYRCVDGHLPERGTLYKSAGTSGKATIWANSYEEELFFERYVQFGMDYAFETGSKDYKIINCWVFGT